MSGCATQCEGSSQRMSRVIAAKEQLCRIVKMLMGMLRKDFPDGRSSCERTKEDMLSELIMSMSMI